MEKTKQKINIISFGRYGNGQTALVAAIRKVLFTKFGFGKDNNIQQLRSYSIKERGVIFKGNITEYETSNYCFCHIDFETEDDMVKALISGAVVADAAIIVCKCNDTLSQKDLKFLNVVGIKNVVVFSNFADESYDKEVYELNEHNNRILLENSGFGHDTPIIVGSGLKAYENPSGEWSKPILKLIDDLDHFAVPVSDKDKPLFMIPSDVFNIEGRGAVANGRIVTGSVASGAQVDLLGYNIKKKRNSFSNCTIWKNSK